MTTHCLGMVMHQPPSHAAIVGFGMVSYDTVQPEILAGIKFGSWALNRHCKNIGGFKFGSSVRDHHTYTCRYETLAELNLAVKN